MKVIGVIPARWASVRFPGKVLADLNGKPLIRHVWEQARKAEALDAVLIACDDQRVADVCRAFGATVKMTSVDHASGTDRTAEAVKDVDADIVVNIQGDEPMVDPETISGLVSVLKDTTDCPMATVVKRVEDPREMVDPNIVKVVVDQKGQALYFSRYAIPFYRDGMPDDPGLGYKHLGLYAYRKDFLMGFCDLPESRLEKTEKLEQLRALEAGCKIKTIVTESESVGVDTPEDLARAAKMVNSKL